MTNEQHEGKRAMLNDNVDQCKQLIPELADLGYYTSDQLHQIITKLENEAISDDELIDVEYFISVTIERDW